MNGWVNISHPKGDPITITYTPQAPGCHTLGRRVLLTRRAYVRVLCFWIADLGQRPSDPRSSSREYRSEGKEGTTKRVGEGGRYVGSLATDRAQGRWQGEARRGIGTGQGAPKVRPGHPSSLAYVRTRGPAGGGRGSEPACNADPGARPRHAGRSAGCACNLGASMGARAMRVTKLQNGLRAPTLWLSLDWTNSTISPYLCVTRTVT